MFEKVGEQAQEFATRLSRRTFFWKVAQAALHVALFTFGLGLLVGSALAAPAAGGEVERFQASGWIEFVSVEGHLATALVWGQSTPGGEFVGVLQLDLAPAGETTCWFQYEDGSTLTFQFATGITPESDEPGGWNLLGGTGLFEDAKGGGALKALFVSPGNYTFEQQGTLKFP
jgi:hypothetical protein